MLISESLSATLENPLAFQNKKKKNSDLSEGTKLKLKQKFLRTQETLKKKFAEAVAPGQTKEFINDVLTEYTNEEEVPGDIQHALNYYEESDALGKMVILALLDHHKYSKEYIMEVFNCSKYRIEQAREMVSSKNSMIFPEKKKKISRCRMDMRKVEHFIDFIFSNGLLQDVAYGVTKLKYNSGDEQTIPHMILKSKYSHTIAFYQQSCFELSYPPLSESTLWRILHAIKHSIRTSLAGLDDITAMGMNGFDTLK